MVKYDATFVLNFTQSRHIGIPFILFFPSFFIESSLRRDTNACVSYRNDVKHQMKNQDNVGKGFLPFFLH
jgi:hypothetical protein